LMERSFRFGGSPVRAPADLARPAVLQAIALARERVTVEAACPPNCTSGSRSPTDHAARTVNLLGVSQGPRVFIPRPHTR